jgi:hypothetical protein
LEADAETLAKTATKSKVALARCALPFFQCASPDGGSHDQGREETSSEQTFSSVSLRCLLFMRGPRPLTPNRSPQALNKASGLLRKHLLQ